MYAHTLYEGGYLDLKKRSQITLLISEISHQDGEGGGRGGGRLLTLKKKKYITLPSSLGQVLP